MSIKLNDVQKRLLPIPESASLGLEPEAKITDFDILKELGSGSFSNVYLVRHKQTGAEYALKAFYKKNKIYAQYKRDIDIILKINHKNLIKVYGYFEDNNYCYFLMDYASKGNVASILPKDKSKHLSTKICSFIIRDIISAIYYLHHLNPPLIHTDIKPENVLLGDDFISKLAGLGLSNYIEIDYGRKAITSPSNYYAPEILDGKNFDELSDLWSIGILLFELIAGNPPFSGYDIDILKDNILKLKINWPKHTNEDAKDLIEKILKIEPKERLSLEEMMKHPFITKFTPDASKLLIKPVEKIKYNPFIISKDNPKTWELKEIK